MVYTCKLKLDSVAAHLVFKRVCLKEYRHKQFEEECI